MHPAYCAFHEHRAGIWKALGRGICRRKKPNIRDLPGHLAQGDSPLPIKESSILGWQDKSEGCFVSQKCRVFGYFLTMTVAQITPSQTYFTW